MTKPVTGLVSMATACCATGRPTGPGCFPRIKQTLEGDLCRSAVKEHKGKLS